MRHFNLFFALYFFSFFCYAVKPDLMLLESYKHQNVTGWVMSEKLDGVRGYWDGKQIFTRGGVQLNPPTYFLEKFPPFAIDGELFSQRDQFADISSIVRAYQDKGWHKLKLYVFDVPDAEGDLFTRLAQLKTYLAQNPSDYIEIIEQIPIENPQHIQQFLQQVEQLKGEGIVIRNPNAPYERKRSSQILKLKTALDEECTVVAHHKGKGQFENVMGSLTCKNHRGQFKIGSGFKLDDRINPPPIGAVITYKYRGLTNKGKPRFATFWRATEQAQIP
ncbi:DNA ligase [Aggregatibacter actinomycetemcomitans]|uniref:DNA ligase n=1 Tax=Aggregatibacter actinomycetemcomitans TaxID=714 RepID=UPI00197CB323|nr:DNA ligase [Aggregatibacter actinomycetemcomitans]MBN6064029.1 DNA ligase [Aggregatibacter actinomycetemcomitans]MBN6083930.1 DNA ligase [Aggregatibacter actinomycetemcomitans]